MNPNDLRSSDWLVNPENPATSPHSYNTLRAPQTQIVQAVFGRKAKKDMTNLERAKMNSPPFGHQTTRPDDVRVMQHGCVTHHPAPNSYQEERKDFLAFK
jgi:hypothetical protein